MKYLYFILLISCGSFSYGQDISDTCLTEKQFNQLKNRIYFLEDNSRLQKFQIRLLTELNRIDTIHNTADSLVVKYFDKTEKLIRIQKKFLRKGCTKDSMVTHFNKDALLSYIENWSSGLCDADTTDKENNYFIYRNCFSRYEYDSLKRLTKYVFHISTPLTRRIVYRYDNEGTKSSDTIAIRDDEFWD
jgi:hypothetical protein